MNNRRLLVGAFITLGALKLLRASQSTSMTTNASESNNLGYIKPVIGKVTSKFGYRTNPITKLQEFHNGIDIAVPIGTEVAAPADGLVLAVITNDLGGRQLIIQHANGYRTGYAHLNKVFLTVGSKVKQGQVVAHTGNTGRSTGPHLHFTLTDPSGKKIDPLLHFKY